MIQSEQQAQELLHEQVERRRFLKQLAAGTTAAWMAGEPLLLPAEDGESIKHPEPSADACIVIWMADIHNVS